MTAAAMVSVSLDLEAVPGGAYKGQLGPSGLKQHLLSVPKHRMEVGLTDLPRAVSERVPAHRRPHQIFLTGDDGRPIIFFAQLLARPTRRHC